MSIIGLDLGSHHASFAIWFPEKEKDLEDSISSSIEVIADDLGSRTIPTAVAFRQSTSPGNTNNDLNGCEALTGSAAVSQQHKNPSNTFDDVRKLLSNSENPSISVPALDKELSVQDLTSHFFRNIHNQVKQQVGKVVRDCVVSIPDDGGPSSLDAAALKRLTEAAQAGGLRIKSFLSDSSATLLAYGLDAKKGPNVRTLVLDVGWSKTVITAVDVSAGLFFPVASKQSAAVSGAVFVQALTDFCAKDFCRKAKFPLAEMGSRSLMRLRRECELAMKALATGQEATIDIDSLCEGIDYSSKISRARFEDLLAAPLVALKLLLTEIASIGEIQQVCLSGGPTSLPKIVQITKTIFPNATFPSTRGRFEISEAQCLGAAVHGKHLLQQSLLENVPTTKAAAQRSQRAVFLASTPSSSAPVEVFPAGTALPAELKLTAAVAPASAKGFLKLLAGSEGSAAPTPVAELVFETKDKTEVTISLNLSVDGLLLEVVSEGVSLGQVNVPLA